MLDLIESRQVRIFISSTFIDMMKERDYLVSKVFPTLRKYCEERDISLYELDLRWGITEEQTKQGKVVETCLQEIKNSKPFFIGLLGDRYGWVPNADEEKLIEENSDVLRDYPWIKDELKNGTSITEIEIQEGVLLSEEKINANFYFRSPVKEFLPEFSEPKGSTTEQKLLNLKNRIREKYPVHVFSSIEELGIMVEKDFKEMVNNLFPKKWISELEKERLEQRSYLKRLTQVYIPHPKQQNIIDEFLLFKNKAMVLNSDTGMGKSAFLADWIQKNDKEENLTKIIYHFVGVTKLEGNYRKIRQRLINEVKRRFFIFQNVRQNSKIETKESEDSGSSEINEDEMTIDEKKKIELQSCLFAIPKNEQLLIILDGLDKLSAKDDSKLLNWLPDYPENVKFIFSANLNDPVMDVFERRNYPVYRILPLPVDNRKSLIKDYLSSYGKKLTENQIQRIINFPESENPMVLCALLDELRFFGIFEKLDEEIDKYVSAKNIGDFYIQVLERLEGIFNYTDTETSNLSKDILCLLYVSKNGLSESEILSLSGAKPVYWSQIYNAIRSNLMSSRGIMKLSHDFIKNAIKEKYLFKKENEDQYRLWLIHYYKTTPNIPKKRLYQELPYHFMELEDFNGLYRFLLNDDVLEFWLKYDLKEFTKFWRTLRETDKNKYDIEKYLGFVKKSDKEDLYYLHFFLGRFITILGDDNESALKHTQMAISLREEIHGKDDESVLDNYDSMGQIYITNGDYPKALEYLQYALDSRIRKLGENHSDTAESYNNFGQLYIKTGNYKKALEYFSKALEIYIKVCGEKHINTANCLNNIGLTLYQLNDYTNAQTMLFKALEIQEEKYGKNHLVTANANNNIGLTYSAMNNHEKALQYYMTAAKIHEVELGKNHIDTAMSYNNAGTALMKAGDYQKAFEYIEKALIIQRDKLGDKHTDTALSYNNLGEAHYFLGNREKCLEYIKLALSIYEEILGKENSQTVLIQNILMHYIKLIEGN